jgi:hypothetical protein
LIEWRPALECPPPQTQSPAPTGWAFVYWGKHAYRDSLHRGLPERETGRRTRCSRGFSAEPGCADLDSRHDGRFCWIAYDTRGRSGCVSRPAEGTAVLTKVLNSSGFGGRTVSGGNHRRNRSGIEEVSSCDLKRRRVWQWESRFQSLPRAWSFAGRVTGSRSRPFEEIFQITLQAPCW